MNTADAGRLPRWSKTWFYLPKRRAEAVMGGWRSAKGGMGGGKHGQKDNIVPTGARADKDTHTDWETEGGASERKKGPEMVG